MKGNTRVELCIKRLQRMILLNVTLCTITRTLLPVYTCYRCILVTSLCTLFVIATFAMEKYTCISECVGGDWLI